MPSWPGSPVRANASHESCIASDSDHRSGPAGPPKNSSAPALPSAPNTKGISSAWHEPATPPKAGVFQVK